MQRAFWRNWCIHTAKEMGQGRILYEVKEVFHGDGGFQRGSYVLPIQR